MSLTLILGGSGIGKSTYIEEKIIARSQEEREMHYLFIVPEQFTLQTQRDLIRRHPRGGLLNIEVLSFQRLAWRIFEETGEKPGDVLTETGKSLILRQVASSNRENLPMLGKRMNQKGYVEKVKSILSEFAQYEIHTEQLDDMIDRSRSRPALQYKLRDLRTLMDAFDRYREDRFLTGEEILEKLARCSVSSQLLRSSVLILDGFTGFTPIQNLVLRSLFSICPEICICITIGASENLYGEICDHELFALSKKTIRNLLRMAHEAHITVEDPVYPDGKKSRFENAPALARLERELFREHSSEEKKEPDPDLLAGTDGISEEYEGLTAISLHEDANPSQEAHAAARMIRRMVDSGQIRYREAAVITGSLPDYEFHVRRSFDALHIPYFIDRKVALNTNPCVDFIRSAIEAASDGLSYSSMIRMLRSGFAILTREETDLTETYVLARGIRGKTRWVGTWEKECQTLTPEEILCCDACRQKVMERFIPFLEVFSAGRAKVSEYVHGLHILLEQFDTEQLLAEKTQAFSEDGNTAKALEYGQIWQVIVSLLEETQHLLGKETVTRQEFAQIIEAGFEEAKVGITPPGLDEVHVGDMERTRLDSIRVLFFLGMNDGWIPASSSDSSLVSQMDREFLAMSGFELAPDIRERSYTQRFYLYLCLTKPSRSLWISYSHSAIDGTQRRPSYMIHVLQDLFPGLHVTQDSSLENMPEAAASPDDALLAFAGEIGKAKEQGSASDALLEMLRQYRMLPHTDENSSMQRLLSHAFPNEEAPDTIGAQLAAALYGENPSGSVSRLELFASCAYEHFLQYGLRLAQREIYEVKAADLGTVFHKALDLFFENIRSAAGKGTAFRDHPVFTDDSLRVKMADECLQKSIELWGKGIFDDTARNRSVVRRMSRILQKTVWALLYQIRQGAFEPAVFEAGFNSANAGEAAFIRVGDRNMELRGRIDRIDRCEDTDKVWLKILDYKSGNKAFDLTELYYGLQLQLPVYMNGALAMEKKVSPDKEPLPGALFYYRMKDPLRKDVWSPDDPEKADQTGAKPSAGLPDSKLLRDLRPDGLLCSDPAVVNALDTHFDRTSDAAPMEKKKDGTLSAARSKAVSSQRMRDLCAFAARKSEDLAARIVQGEIQALPCRRKNFIVCDWCSLKEACPWDRHIPGCTSRQIREFPNEDAIWEIIGQQTSKE